MKKKDKDELIERVKEVNVLDVDENSIVVIHFDISNMVPSELETFYKTTANRLFPVFKKRGADLIIMPFRKEQQTSIDVIKTANLESYVKPLSEVELKQKAPKRKFALTEGKTRAAVKKQTSNKKPIAKPPAPKKKTTKKKKTVNKVEFF